MTTALTPAPHQQTVHDSPDDVREQPFRARPQTASTSSNAASGDTILETVYHFRDEVMRQSAVGRRYIRKYYQHAWEVSWLLVRNPGLRAEVATVLELLHPILDTAVDGRSAVLPREHVSAIETLLDDVAAKASSKLRKTIRRLRADLRRGRLSSIRILMDG